MPKAERRTAAAEPPSTEIRLRSQETQVLALAAQRGHKVVRYAADELIFREGDDGRDLFVLIRGCLLVTRKQEALAKVDEPFYFLGESSSLDGLPRPYTLSALEPSLVLVLPPEAVPELIDYSVDMAKGYLRSLSRAIGGSERRLETGRRRLLAARNAIAAEHARDVRTYKAVVHVLTLLAERDPVQPITELLRFAAASRFMNNGAAWSPNLWDWQAYPGISKLLDGKNGNGGVRTVPPPGESAPATGRARRRT